MPFPFVWVINFISVILLGVWVYLVVMVWKKKAYIFRDQMESKLAIRRYKMLKVSLLVAGVSCAVYWVSILGIAMTFDPPPAPFLGVLITFGLACGVVLFPIATIGSLVIFLRRKTT